MKKIYLDHSATTPVDKKVLAAMLPYFSAEFGNSSSLHSFGQAAATAVLSARENIAKFLNCGSKEVIFTSGATESDNLAILGLIRAIREKTKKKLHIITSSIEHPAVLEPFSLLEKDGVRVTYLPVARNGIIKLSEFEKAIKDDTVLVSAMYVNSEVGSIQPIRQMGKIIKKINQSRLKKRQRNKRDWRGEKLLPIYFHTDAVQAVNFLNCDVKYLGVDLLSLSSHKIYGPKGVGVLFVRKGIPINPIQFGGHQEKNLRSGTLNVPSIVGLGAAIELVRERQKKNNERIANLKDRLVRGIMKNIPDIVLNTDLKSTAPSHAHFSFNGVEGESILIALDLAGVAVSTGSACASGDLKASHVLLAMGLSEEAAHNSVRFTLGKNTTEDEIDRIIKILPSIIKRLRQIAPKL